MGQATSDTGNLAVHPDVYDLSICRHLLAYLLMPDEMERERAERLEADSTTGKAPRTADNLCKFAHQFERANEHDVIPIDFIWGLHHFVNCGFRALQFGATSSNWVSTA